MFIYILAIIFGALVLMSARQQSARLGAAHLDGAVTNDVLALRARALRVRLSGSMEQH